MALRYDLQGSLNELKEVLVEYVKLYPWAYAVVLLLVSKLVNSQAAAIAIVVPVAISIGTPTGVVVGCCSLATATTSSDISV